MTYAMNLLSCDPAKLTGLSERLILSHHENNYGGAVKRLNAITAQLQSLDFSLCGTAQWGRDCFVFQS